MGVGWMLVCILLCGTLVWSIGISRSRSRQFSDKLGSVQMKLTRSWSVLWQSWGRCPEVVSLEQK